MHSSRNKRRQRALSRLYEERRAMDRAGWPVTDNEYKRVSGEIDSLERKLKLH